MDAQSDNGSTLLLPVLLSLQQFSAQGISWAGCVSCSKLQRMSLLCIWPVFPCDPCVSRAAFGSEFQRFAHQCSNFLSLPGFCLLPPISLYWERQWITNAMVINALSHFSGCSWLDWCILSWLSFPSCIVLAYPVLCTCVHYPCWSFLVWPYPFRKETRAAQVLKMWVNHRFTQRHGVCFWFISIPS